MVVVPAGRRRAGMVTDEAAAESERKEQKAQKAQED